MIFILKKIIQNRKFLTIIYLNQLALHYLNLALLKLNKN